MTTIAFITRPLPRAAVTAFLATLAAASTGRAQAFEGAVTMRVGIGGAESAVQQVEYLLRGDKARINMQTRGRTVSMIAVPAEKKMYMLMDAQSMYIEMSTDPANNPSMKSASDAAAREIEKAGAPKITRTGKKETIAGYECEHVLVASATQSFDICTTKMLGAFVNAFGALGGMGGAGRGGAGRGGAERGGAAPQNWQQMLGEVGAFPLKVTSKDGGITLEVIKVEKRSIPAAQLEVPANYSKMTMPARPPGR